MGTFFRRILALLTMLFLLSGEALALTITNVSTQDTNSNGQIDRLNLSFDTDLNPATVSDSDFSVAGYTTSNATVSGIDPSQVELTLNESGAPDTGATPNLGISAGETIEDILFTTLDDTFPGIVATDMARPVVQSLTTTTGTGTYPTGTNILITAVVSENVTAGALTLNFNNGDSLILNANGTNTVSNTYTVGGGDDTPDLQVTSSTNTLADAGGNIAISTIPVFGATKTLAIDTIDPVVTETTNLGTYQTTNTPSYTFTSSEAGTISYAGNCSSGTTAGVSGANNVTFNALAEGLQNNCVVTVTDGAGNTGSTNVSAFTVDTIAPTIDTVSIVSNNANTALAKTNDTITVNFTFTEANPNAQIINQSILGQAATDSINNIAKTGSIARFTTGVEPSEVVVPFQFQLQDEAGNTSAVINAVTNGSSVTFDRTNPMINRVEITATSADNTAFLGDTPIYYAKTGDDITLTIEAMDHVDIQSMTGTILGKAVNLANGGGNVWSTTINPNGIDAEGDVPFSITVTDNAGNTVVTTLPTIAGNKVVFDRTLPDQPTQTVDLEGEETFNFKHRLQADYTWTGQQDLDATDTFQGSGIQDYRVQYFHPTFGTLHDTRVSNATFRPNLLTPDDDPYFLLLNTRDKAGNETITLQAYEQRYTIGIIGVVRDTNGNPLENAFVQVVSRFNDFCNNPQEVCVDQTNAQGQYFIVTQKERDYTISAWKSPYHYMQKEQTRVELDDTILDFNLAMITTPREIQGSQQGVVVETDATFLVEDNTFIPTTIIVNTIGGEITVTEIEPGTFQITSLSRIGGVSSNNPAATINLIAPNTYEVTSVGDPIRTYSLYNAEGTTSVGVSSRGTNTNFNSGNSRIGVEVITGNGKSNRRQTGSDRSDFVSVSDAISYEESLAEAQRFNQGTAAKVHSYINRNGHTVFSGYQNGRMALDRFKHRHQNTVAYRGGYRTPWKSRERVVTTNPGGREIVKYVATASLAEKTAAMKERYQNNRTTKKEHLPGNNPNTVEAFVTYGREGNHHGLKRVKNDQIQSVKAKKINDQFAVNKFERTRPFPHSAGTSRITAKDQNTIVMFKGVGGVSAADMFGN